MDNKIKFAPIAVFCTFFIAELGDKTQLTAITFGANEGLDKAIIVWVACSIGLFAADIIGMLVDYLLKSKAPEGILNTLAFVIFSLFGVYTFYQGMTFYLTEGYSAIYATLASGVIFAIACGVVVLLKKRKN